jgi:hypothetical protein
MRVPFRTQFCATAAPDRVPVGAGDYPTPGELLTEIGVLLAIHLAVAIAVAVTLRFFGIA